MLLWSMTLKRTPLQLGVGLSRGKELKKGPPLESNSRLPQRSKKTAEFYAKERIPFVIKFLADHPMCAANLRGCQGESVDVDEILPRSLGGNVVPIDENDSNFRAVCRVCHTLITDRDPEAEKKGLLA